MTTTGDYKKLLNIERAKVHIIIYLACNGQSSWVKTLNHVREKGYSEQTVRPIPWELIDRDILVWVQGTHDLKLSHEFLSREGDEEYD